MGCAFHQKGTKTAKHDATTEKTPQPGDFESCIGHFAVILSQDQLHSNHMPMWLTANNGAFMTNNPSIVVFDIGNVLIRWDMHFLYESFFPSREDAQAFIDEVGLTDWNLEQDRGRDWKEAEELLLDAYPNYAKEIRAFRGQWHDMVPGVIAGSVLIKERLEEMNVPLYAITNFAADTFAECQERFPTLKRFKDIVISGDEKVVKPDPAIYEILLERNNLKAEDCLFVDDSPKNVEAARSVGMRAHHFQSPFLFAEDLRNFGFAI